MHELSVKYFANREIRVTTGVAVSRGRKKSENESPLDISSKVQQPQNDVCHLPEEIGEDSAEGGGRVPYPGTQERVKIGWGKLGRQDRTFNAGSRHGLLEAGAVCDMWFGKKALILTGTLPGSMNECNEQLAAYSGYIVNRINQYCRRKFGGQLWCFYVWEWQARGALHIHYCVAGDNYRGLHLLKDGWHDFWCEVLDSVSIQSGVDLYRRNNGFSWRTDKSKVQADGQLVKKSVAAYFAKYAGKEYHENSKKKMKANGVKRYVPARWSGWSQSVGRAMKSCRWEFKIIGSRRKIEGKLDEIKYLCSKLAVASRRWKWKVLPGETFLYYISVNDLLEVQGFMSDNLGVEDKMVGRVATKEIEQAFKTKYLRGQFELFAEKKWGNRKLSWKTNMVFSYGQQQLTEKGLLELLSLARIFNASRKRYG